MTAIDELRGISGIIVESDIEVLMYKAILELADNLRITQVAIEQRDMKIGELEGRVKTLVDVVKQAPKWNKPLVFGPVDPVAYPRTILDPEVIKKAREAIFPQPKPAPAPDLETLVEKYFGQLTKATFDINVPVMQAFKDILRAFAAELGCKP